MNIAVDARNYFRPKVGGMATYAMQLLNAISHQDSYDTFTLLTDQGGPFIDLPNNFTSTLLRKGPMWPQLQLTAHLIRNSSRYKLVFYPTQSSPFLHLSPTVATIHDIAYIHYPQTFTPSLYWQLKILTENTLRHADHLLADSFSTKKDLIDYYHISDKRITVAHLGVDFNHFYPRTESEIIKIRQTYNIHKPYIVHVGTIQERKNLVRLIQAFEQLPEARNKEIELVLVGAKGWHSDPIYKAANNSRLNELIHILDFLPYTDIPGILSGAMGLVMPSLYEGFGLPIAEAMACGTITVIANNSSLPEVGGDAAIYIENALKVDSIVSSLRTLIALDQQEIEHLKILQLQQASGFTWAKCAQTTLNVFHQFV